jgi:hypothetical protein
MDEESEKEASALLSAAASEQSFSSDVDDSDPESCETTPTEGEEEISSETADSSPDIKTTPASTPVASPPAKPKAPKIPISELFIPKVKLLKLLLEIDFSAGCVIIGNTFLSGALLSLKTHTSTQLSASMMQILITKTIDTQELSSILIQHVLFQIIFQGLLLITAYAYKRASRPLRKAMHIELMEAYTSMPYQIMMTREIGDQFRKV